MGCGDCFSKCFLVVFNMIFLLFGGGCVGIGIYILVDKSKILVLTRSVDTSNLDVPSLLETAAYAFIGGGSFILIVAFLGCCGACMKNRKLLCTYAVIVGLILALEMAAVILAAVYKDQFETYAKDNLFTLLQTRYIGPYDTSDIISIAFDLVNLLFSCCGVNSGVDYAQATLWNTTYLYDSGGGNYVNETAVIPLTCCKFGNDDAFPDDYTTFLTSIVNTTCPFTKAESNYDTGCYEALKDRFSTYFNIMIVVGAVIGGLQVLGVISACCLMKNNKKEEKEDY